MGCCFEKGQDEYVEISRKSTKANLAENAAFDDEHPKLNQQVKIREKRKQCARASQVLHLMIW